MTGERSRPDEPFGGLAAVLAHPDDESFTAAGALALAHDARPHGAAAAPHPRRGRQRRRRPGRRPGRSREEEMRCAAAKIGMDEVTLAGPLPGRAAVGGAVLELVDEIALWLADRRPDAVITFGAHGVTDDADHVVVGAATRWAVERLAEPGIAPHAVYVVAPVFGPGQRRLRPLPGGGRRQPSDRHHRGRRQRKLAALACHAPGGHARGDRRAARRARPRGRRLRGLHPRPPRPCPRPEVRHAPYLSSRPARFGRAGLRPC